MLSIGKSAHICHAGVTNRKGKIMFIGNRMSVKLPDRGNVEIGPYSFRVWPGFNREIMRINYDRRFQAPPLIMAPFENFEEPLKELDHVHR